MQGHIICSWDWARASLSRIQCRWFDHWRTSSSSSPGCPSVPLIYRTPIGNSTLEWRFILLPSNSAGNVCSIKLHLRLLPTTAIEIGPIKSVAWQHSFTDTRTVAGRNAAATHWAHLRSGPGFHLVSTGYFGITSIHQRTIYKISIDAATNYFEILPGLACWFRYCFGSRNDSWRQPMGWRLQQTRLDVVIATSLPVCLLLLGFRRRTSKLIIRDACSNGHKNVHHRHSTAKSLKISSFSLHFLQKLSTRERERLLLLLLALRCKGDILFQNFFLLFFFFFNFFC